MLRAAVTIAATLALVTCGMRPDPPPPAMTVTEAHANPGDPDHVTHAQAGTSTASEADLLEGQQIYEDVCAECHAMDPPPTLAPPMRMVSGHLHEEFETEQEAVAHILSYLPMPNPDRSILPEHAIERFGLMPPQPLPAADLEKVARYIWTLSEGMEMDGMHEGEGPGMHTRMRRRGGG